MIFIETIRTYTNTKCELEVAKIRLSLLMDRKEQLYAKYFPITQQIKDDIIAGGKKDNDKMAMYVHELNEVDIGTGFSLAQEIEYQRSIIERDTQYINEMNETLNKNTGIEYALYYEIVIKGVSVSKAVSNIAERYYLEERTIWKYHYRKIKSFLKKLEKVSESTVNYAI